MMTPSVPMAAETIGHVQLCSFATDSRRSAQASGVCADLGANDGGSRLDGAREAISWDCSRRSFGLRVPPDGGRCHILGVHGGAGSLYARYLEDDRLARRDDSG